MSLQQVAAEGTSRTENDRHPTEITLPSSEIAAAFSASSNSSLLPRKRGENGDSRDTGPTYPEVPLGPWSVSSAKLDQENTPLRPGPPFSSLLLPTTDSCEVCALSTWTGRLRRRHPLELVPMSPVTVALSLSSIRSGWELRRKVRGRWNTASQPETETISADVPLAFRFRFFLEVSTTPSF